jgi:hypothetical protein
MEKNKNPDLKKIFPHVICATDTTKLKEVFEEKDIQEVLLRDEKMI